MINDYLKPPSEVSILEGVVEGNKDDHGDPIYENPVAVREVLDGCLNQGYEKPHWLYGPDKRFVEDPVRYGISFVIKMWNVAKEDGRLFVWPKDQRLVPPCEGEPLKRFPMLPVRRVGSRKPWEKDAGKPMYAHLCDALRTIKPGHVFVGVDYKDSDSKWMGSRMIDWARAWTYIEDILDDSTEIKLPEIKLDLYEGSRYISVEVPSFAGEDTYNVTIERAVLIDKARFRKGEVLPRPLTVEEGAASFSTEITSNSPVEKHTKNVAGREIYMTTRPRLLDPLGIRDHEYRKRKPKEQLISYAGVSGYFISELRLEKENKRLIPMFPHPSKNTVKFIEACANQMLIEKSEFELASADIGKDGRAIPSERYRPPTIAEMEVALFQWCGVMNILKKHHPDLEETLNELM